MKFRRNQQCNNLRNRIEPVSSVIKLLPAGSGIKVYSLVACILLSCFFLLNSCKSYKKQQDEMPDTRISGRINVSADESFKPVIDEQVQVFESWYPEAKINVQYKPEAQTLKDIENDSIRMIITTRAFTEQEENYLLDSLKIDAITRIMA